MKSVIDHGGKKCGTCEHLYSEKGKRSENIVHEY